MGSGSLVASGALLPAGSDVSGEGPSLVGSPPVGPGSDGSPVLDDVGADVDDVAPLVADVGADVAEVDEDAADEDVAGELDVVGAAEVTGCGATLVDGVEVMGAVFEGSTPGPGSSESPQAPTNRRTGRLPRSARKEWEGEEEAERRVMTPPQCLSGPASANETPRPAQDAMIDGNVSDCGTTGAKSSRFAVTRRSKGSKISLPRWRV